MDSPMPLGLPHHDGDSATGEGAPPLALKYLLGQVSTPDHCTWTTTKLQRERVIELQYADDCALVSHSPQDLQSVLAAAVRAYSRMGLTVNTSKTEVVCQRSFNKPLTPPTFTVSGEQLETDPSFRYLGSILSEENTIGSEVQNTIKQAETVFGRLRHRVFQKRNLHLSTKVLRCITTRHLHHYPPLQLRSLGNLQLPHQGPRAVPYTLSPAHPGDYMA